MSFREEFAAGGTCFPETWENGKGKILQPVCIVLHFRDGAVLKKLAAISLSFQKSKYVERGKGWNIHYIHARAPPFFPSSFPIPLLHLLINQICQTYFILAGEGMSKVGRGQKGGGEIKEAKVIEGRGWILWRLFWRMICCSIQS